MFSSFLASQLWILLCNKCLKVNLGGSPGLVVMGGDSCSGGRGFESQHRILDGHFFHVYLL